MITSLIALVAALGVGSITASLISHRIAIAGHRQVWINGLRDDLSLFFEALTTNESYWLDGNVSLTGLDHEQLVKKTRRAAMLVFYRIRLRLNASEKLHADLAASLEGLMVVGPTSIHETNLENAVDLARQLLKTEWEVVKSLPLLMGSGWVASAWHRVNRS